MSKYFIEKFDINKNYKGLKSFDCGNEMINKFVHKQLKKRVKRDLSKAYVLLDDDKFIAFYTLDSFAITRESLNISSGLPPMVPVIKIGMLGVDKNYQGKGLGKRLLKDAFVRILKASEIVGFVGVFLLAEERAVSFYESLGFIKLKDTLPTPMFLDIKVLKDLR